MSNNCTGSCSGCNGCGESFVLSTDKNVTFVSSFTFTVRELEKYPEITLVTECMKIGETGRCYVGIGYYKNDELLDISQPCKYEITETDLKQYQFRFPSERNADKAEITVKCVDGATLHVEHINILN